MGRVCQLVHSLNVGGAEVLAARFARRLGGPKQVSFACLDDFGPLGQRLRDEGYAVTVLDRRPGLDLACARRLRRLVREQRIDLIHAHQVTPFLYAAIGRGLSRRPPILFTEHGRFFPDYPHRKRMLINPWLLGRNDRVVAVGEGVKTALIEFEGFPRDRIEVVYNGIDLSRYGVDANDHAKTRAELGVRPNEFMILHVARLDPIKDHPTAVKAMKLLGNRQPGAKLFFVGGGPERATIEAAIAREGVGDRVTLLGERHDVPRLLAAADAFVLSSVSEGIPLTVLEAMAARTPVVATRVGGLPEVIVEGESGFLVSASDPAAMAQAFERLIVDPSLRARVAEEGRQRVERLFDEDAMMRRYDEIHREMLGGGEA